MICLVTKRFCLPRGDVRQPSNIEDLRTNLKRQPPAHLCLVVRMNTTGDVTDIVGDADACANDVCSIFLSLVSLCLSQDTCLGKWYFKNEKLAS